MLKRKGLISGDKMPVYSIIRKSQIEGSHRMDAEYYQPEYFIDFSKGTWLPIRNIISQCQYGISQAMTQEKVGYPIFRMDDIKHAFLFDDEVKYIDLEKKVFNDFKIEKDDVLFNRVNSEDFVGRTGIFKLNGDYTFASYLIRLKVNRKNLVLPDYLNIFLNSSYGLKQIRKFRRRSVNQANVNAEELKQIKIALLPLKVQEEIAKFSNEAWRRIDFSKSLYSQAENLLLEELGLKDFKPQEDLSYVVNLSNIKSVHRADAEYFQPKYEKLIGFLGKDKQSLNMLAKRKSKRIKLIPENPYRYIEISDIDIGCGEISFNIVQGHELPANAKTKIEGGELIVSKVRPTRGGVGIVPEDWDNNFVASGAFSVFEVPSPTREYLQVVLRTIIGKLQLEKPTTGSSYPTVDDEDVEKLLIPVLPKPIQQRISALVHQSHEARKKAKELLEEAKRKVEEAIEGK